MAAACGSFIHVGCWLRRVGFLQCLPADHFAHHHDAPEATTTATTQPPAPNTTPPVSATTTTTTTITTTIAAPATTTTSTTTTAAATTVATAPTTTAAPGGGTVVSSPATTPTTTTVPPATATTTISSQRLELGPRDVLSDPRLAGKFFRNSPSELVSGLNIDTAEEKQRRDAQFRKLWQIRHSTSDAPLHSREPLITTPEGLMLLEEYEKAMATSLYNVYNTCGGSRFPQVTSDSSMTDFINPDLNRELEIPPAGQTVQWYFRQAAQSAYDIAQFNRENIVRQGRHVLLCTPLLFAVPLNIIPAKATSNTSVHDGRISILPPPSSPWRFHIAAATADRSVIVMVECYVGSDADQYRRFPPYAISSYVWEDGKYKYHHGYTTVGGDDFQSCEHPFNIADQYVTILNQPVAEGTSPRLNIDAEFEMFDFGEYSYTDSGFASFPS